MQITKCPSFARSSPGSLDHPNESARSEELREDSRSAYDRTDESACTTEPPVVSLLECLCAPCPSDLS